MATYLYVSLQDDDVIARYDLDPATGGLTGSGRVSAGGNAGADGDGPGEAVPVRGTATAGRIRDDVVPHRGRQRDLERISDVNLDGNPVHVSTDKTGKYLLSAYYYQSRVGVHRFGDDGALDPSPIEWRRQASVPITCRRTPPTATPSCRTSPKVRRPDPTPSSSSGSTRQRGD